MNFLQMALLIVFVLNALLATVALVAVAGVLRIEGASGERALRGMLIAHGAAAVGAAIFMHSDRLVVAAGAVGVVLAIIDVKRGFKTSWVRAIAATVSGVAAPFLLIWLPLGYLFVSELEKGSIW